MNASAGHEQLLVEDIDAWRFVARDLEPAMLTLNAWLVTCTAQLTMARLSWPGLAADHPLAVAAQQINDLTEDCLAGAARQWLSLRPAQDLAATLDDKVVMLVYGKFNAGKSSFCNFLAERFASYGKAVDYFYLDAGRLVGTETGFQEGATETTARLQGVHLAEHLVLLDTPGLHSVTQDNASLTQLFTDSADAVLWLTSSTSPGQVQELEELSRELQRYKPLLPVLTRSDVYDEDEIDGEIVTVLRGKTAENRAEQEADVALRASHKLAAMGLDVSLLKPPVSISSHLARAGGQTPDALGAAGFDVLYAGLRKLVAPALAYKRRKQGEVLLHHLEENVSGAFKATLEPRIAALRDLAARARADLGPQEEALAGALWRLLVPRLPAWLDAYAASGDWETLDSNLSQALGAAYHSEATTRLGTYALPVASSCPATGLPPPHAGSADLSEGVDYQGLYATLTNAVRAAVLRLSAAAVAHCLASIDVLDQLVWQLGQVIAANQKDLQGLKAGLRALPPES